MYIPIVKINKRQASINSHAYSKAMYNLNESNLYCKDIFSLNTSPFAHGSAKYDKSSRSVTNQQGNAILYDKKRMEEDIKELLKTSPGKSKEVPNKSTNKTQSQAKQSDQNSICLQSSSLILCNHSIK